MSLICLKVLCAGRLGRTYFPGVTMEKLDSASKARLIADIRADFAAAEQSIHTLPQTVRPAVTAAYQYYSKLLERIEHAPLATLKETRIRLSNPGKIRILVSSAALERLRHRA